MDLKRGFITVATGKYYYELAENLIMSYKLFSDAHYPFFVITDYAGEKRLSRYFDGVVVLDETYSTFMDKMLIYYNSPFDETIFIDADSNIVNDISWLFDAFEKNGSDISCIGELRKIDSKNQPNHFGMNAINAYKLKEFIAFNGGVYYFRKSNRAAECLKYIFDELVPNYSFYELKYFRGNQMADEPLFGLAMLIYEFYPLDLDLDIMKLVQGINSLSWDLDNRRCEFTWYGFNVSPSILHYGTHNTYTRKYINYNVKVKAKYFNLSEIATLWLFFKSEIRLFFRLCMNESTRKDMIEWFMGHFSIDYIKSKVLR